MLRKKILLVENDGLSNDALLVDLGYDVLTASSGEEAIKLAQLMGNINLVLMDTKLGSGIDGITAAKEILSKKDIPIVFITSQTNKDFVNRVKQVSRYGFIPKGSGEFVIQSTIEMAFELYESNLKLLAAGERNQKLLNHLAVGVVVHAADTSIIANNNRASELLGLDDDQMRGKKAVDPFWKFVDKDGNILAYENYPVNQIINTGEPMINQTFGVIHQEDHEITWLEVNGVPNRKNHNLVEVIISFLDVTDRINLIKALKESESRYKHLFDNNPQAMWICDADEFTFLEVNEAAIRKYGYSQDEFMRMSVSDILPKNDRDKLINPHYQYTGTEAQEWDHQKKNGEIMNVEVKSHPIDHEDRNARLTLVNDITVLKNKEKLIRESEQFAYGSLNALQSQIAILDEKGVILSVNEAWKHFAENNAKTESPIYHIGNNYLDVCKHSKGKNSEEAPGMYEGLLATLNGEKSYFSLEYPCHSPTEKRWFQVQVTSFNIGDKLRVVVAHENISKRILSEMKMKELLQEKEIVLHEVHHRIKNNVNMVSGLLFLQATTTENKEVANELNDAVGRLKSMGHIYDQLFKSENFDQISVQGYLTQLIKDISGVFRNYNIKINEEIEDFILSSKDLTALGIIVNELITNGVKHAFPENKEGEINLNLNRSNGSVLLVYQDNGIGISEKANDTDSFGLKLIELLTGQLKGNHTVQSANGTKFLIEFPYNLN
ncbi:PAS domain S-box protein [Fulvivirga lutimaris]|uniref:PAS domain S-box protein n=1 Tax=Fulvivirga lutimaris TaxID=1819566 RepID=UPI0012BC86A5|nr:PAS domain S-box protein [Fulvivirga lutimaris]MTI41204.1 PAS domain S-box protein [Fulvivirga lutimaris]